MQNWYTKAPSGGLQQCYPRGGMNSCRSPYQRAGFHWKSQRLQDYPGTESYRNSLCQKVEKQIIGGSYTFGGTRTGQRWGKSSRESVPCSAKPPSPFCSCPSCSCPSLGSEALWSSPCRLVWAFSFLPPVPLGKFIWDAPGLICKPLKNLPHFLGLYF